MSGNSGQKQWQSAPHQFGPGKIHIIDPDDESTTYCGQALQSIGGGRAASAANCKTCLKSVESRRARAEYAEKYKVEQQEREHARLAADREWGQRYASHMKSPKWSAIRALVLKRAGGMCEGCGTARASEVHHMSYENMGDEFLWELRAVCRPCHERWHDASSARAKAREGVVV